jgi:hypothetical protein
MKRCGYPDALIQKRVSDLKQQKQRLQSSPHKSALTVHAEYAIERKKEEVLRKKFLQLLHSREADSDSTK